MVVPNLPTCRVPVSFSSRTKPERIAVVPNTPARFGRVLRLYRICTGNPGSAVEGIPIPGICLGGCTELTDEIPNLLKCPVAVSRPYRENIRIPGIAIKGITVPGVYWGGHT